jgi:hypothetical protein
MINTEAQRVKISQLIQNQLPDFVVSENPLFVDFLKTYYISQDHHGGPSDLGENLDYYTKFDSLVGSALTSYTELSYSIESYSKTITVKSAAGFPDSYGLLKIDDEIITYTGLKAVAPSQTFTVRVSQSELSGENVKFFINGEESPLLSFKKSGTYIFDQSHVSNTGFYLKFSTTQDGIWNSGVEYTTGVTVTGTPGKDGKVKIVVSESAPLTLYVYNASVEAMYGDGEISVDSLVKNTFTGCIRGFSGVDNLQKTNRKDVLSFISTKAASHNKKSRVQNLSSLFAREFYKKIKSTYATDFEGVDFNSEIDKINFIRQIKDFYLSKGTEESFKILFRVLFGVESQIIKPQDYLFKPSDADYTKSYKIVVQHANKLYRNRGAGELVNVPDVKDVEGSTLVQTSPRVSASISNVSEFRYNDESYYILSVPTDQTVGRFTISSRTRLTADVPASSSSLTVDSTLGFPSSGTLVLNGYETVRYTSKTFNQFLGLSSFARNYSYGDDVILQSSVYAYSSVEPDVKIDLIITGVLSKLDIPSDHRLLRSGDVIRAGAQGIVKQESDEKFNSWIFNPSVNFEIKSITSTLVAGSFQIETKTKHNFIDKDTVEIIYKKKGEKILCTVSSISGSNTLIVSGANNLVPNQAIYLRRKTLFGKSSIYKSVEKYTTDVQNVYDNNGDLYVTSTSIPSLLQRSIDVSDRSVSWEGASSGTAVQVTTGFVDHGFYSGDLVKFTALSGSLGSLINKKNYYVKRVDSNRIRFANSLVDLVNERFVNVNGTGKFKIEIPEFSGKTIENQKLLKRVQQKVNFDGSINETLPGTTGILINGVEILNYKSGDKVFYGPIESIDVLGGGENYDVINPPTVIFESDNGTAASAICCVKGSLQKIEVIDPGFDYIETPTIAITGGNGQGATAEVRMESFLHFVDLDSSSGKTVDTTNNLIGFGTFHKFENGEEVIYRTFGKQGIGIAGVTTTLINNASYFVSRVGPSSIALANDSVNAINGTNLIDLNALGVGKHRFESAQLKQKIGEIIVTNSGSDYSNKKRLIKSVGINTFTSTLSYKNHNFNDGDLVQYKTSSVSIGGLFNNNYYHILKVDDNNFKLCFAGSTLSSISLTNYQTQQYVGITSFGSGNHILNYPPISVTVSGKIGIKKSAIEDYTAKIRPLFRGSITSVDVENEGRNYGYSSILNNQRPVSIRVSAANTQSSYKAIVNEVGSITDVIISKTGGGYVSPPELVVFGDGVGAELVAVSAGSSITSVKIKNGGVGYSTSNLSIVEKLPGNGAKFFVNLKSWTVNNVKRFENKISSDDGFLVVGDGGNGIKFTSLYAPRELRKSIKQKNNNGSINYTQNDLQFIGNVEKDSKSHSPIIGWAYDGNPIYGPYGYENKNGGQVKLLTSSYSLKSARLNGPPTSTFPLGFFVDDYEYLGNGDLDANNGRFCVTPDYPEGTYAYFATFSKKNSTSGTFKNYKEPQFPYLIGQNYAANPDEYNFNKFNNQSKNINTNQYHRNTYPYRLGDFGALYEGLYQNDFTEEIKIKSSSTGGIDSAIIQNAGNGYTVGESFVLDKDTVTGSGFYAEVTKVRGKAIKSVSSSITEIENVVILYNKGTGQITGFSPTPHSLINNDLVTISGVSTESFKNLNRQFNVSIIDPIYSLSKGIGNTSTTGIVTTIYVTGPDINDLNNISPNDIIAFGNEQMLVLNVDSVNGGLRVLRKYSNAGGGSISAGNKLTLSTKKITFNSGINTNVETNRNLPYYFDPSELVGIGTSFGVGIGSTISYSINVPGNISTTRFIPTRTIYLPGHKFKTGDSLTYSNGSGSSIIVSNGSTTFSLQDSSTVYAIATSLDLLGISTTKNGTQVSFVNVGSGKYHSFTPQKQEYKVIVEKIIATVVCDEAHNLSLLDNVELSLTPGISTTISVRYDLDTNLTLFNPLTFNSTGINTNSSKITIQNHGLQDGDKVLYSSSNPASPLQNKKSYYAIRLDKNNIRLATTYFNAIKDFPTFVGIATTGGPSHTISKINPKVDIINGFKVVFDLSDSSLSQSVSGKKIEVFDFNLYRDKNFTIPYHSNAGENKFNVVKIGKVGIGTAKIQFDVTENTPKQIFYRLEPKSLDLIDDKHKNPVVDDDVFSNNTLKVVGKSLYNQSSSVVGVATTTFQINLKFEPEKSSYKDVETTSIKYSTTSTNIKGPIDAVKIYSQGVEFNYPPNVSSIGSTGNSTAIIKLSGRNLGKIKNTELVNFGFNYSSDLTLRPTAIFPQVVRLESLSKLKSIQIVKGGKNYTTPPNIIVVDSTTNAQSSGFVFDTKLNGTSIANIKILVSPDDLFSVEPKVFAVNNTNGVGITTVSFNSSTKTVTVVLNKTFTNATFPFRIGDSVFVENIGITSTGDGFNSANYQYKNFTIVGVSTSANQLSYQITSSNPGTFSPTKSSGRVILSSDLPQFKSTIQPSKFSKNETFYTKDGKNFGEIISMDEKNKIAKVISNVKPLSAGDVIVGNSSKSSAVISNSETVVSYFNVNSSAFTVDGWQKDTGILSNELQKIHDSDYYQQFSYSVKSTIPKQKWDSVVDSTAHIVGFKNFADLQVVSIPENTATVKPAIITTIFR